MRILVLTNMYPPHAFGGYELSCRDVVRRWRRHGHEVLVLTSDLRLASPMEEPGAEGEDEPGRVWRRLHLYWRDHVMLDPPPLTRLRWERDNRRSLEAAVAALRPDVVSAWAMGAMSLSLVTRAGELGLPVVCVVCDEWPIYGPEVDAWTRLFVRRPRLGRAVRAVAGVPTHLPDLDALGPACFVSAAMLAKCREHARWGFPGAAVVPSGIDPRDFPLAGSAGRRPWEWRLLHVGRADPRKGIATVIEALAQCPPEATLELLGGGEEGHLAELRALAARLGVAQRVRFGVCPRSALAARYAAADAVVFAPLWDEPFGLVPLEAMACATPVVASPTGGSTEFLEDGVNCLAFSSGDAAGLAERLTGLAADPARRQRLIEGGLATAARYSVERQADELESVHRRARAERAGAGR